jgi:hypothetical protein
MNSLAACPALQKPCFNRIVAFVPDMDSGICRAPFLSPIVGPSYQLPHLPCASIQVRKVVLASSPNVDRDNIVPYPGWEQGSSADATVQMLDNDVAKAVANNVKLDAVWKLGQVRSGSALLFVFVLVFFSLPRLVSSSHASLPVVLHFVGGATPSGSWARC